MEKTLDFQSVSLNAATRTDEPDGEEHILKAGLIAQLGHLIRVHKLTQTAAANRLGVKQPDLSNILRGHVRGYSMERLMHMLAAFDQDIDIVVRPRKHAGKGGRITLMRAIG
jgi:predicted XRE-type DNA-binding protein